MVNLTSSPDSRDHRLERMRARLLAASELGGFAAITGAGALAGYGIAGWIAGAAVGLLVAGLEAVYLSNAYALSAEEGE